MNTIKWSDFEQAIGQQCSLCSPLLPFMISGEPTPFPETLYNKANAHQSLFNKLVAALHDDHDYLYSIAEKTAQGDASFTGRLLQIWQRTRRNAQENEPLFYILRSDYMIDGDAIKQIELNTFSSASGCVCAALSDVHGLKCSQVPKNAFTMDAAKAFALVHSDWCRINAVDDACILMIVHDQDRNIVDQQLLLDALDVPWFRVPLHSTDIEFEQGKLYFNGTIVSIVYYRTGYMPEHYNEQGWTNRELIEKSNAVKCPNIAVHLAGLKSLQQALCDRVFIDRHGLDELSECFAEILSLEEYEECARSLADDPAGWVLKPQREGGGNNVYGLSVHKHITAIPENERTAFILMKLIKPPTVNNVLAVGANGHQRIIDHAVSELGIFGIYYRSASGLIIMDNASGYLMRTKSKDVNEGGFAAGYSILDAPCLQ